MPTSNAPRVAMLATDGFEQSELTKPKKALEDAGATVHVVAPKGGTIRGWDEDDWGDSVDVDVALGDASASDYDLLVLPGGVINPDTLRQNADAVAFVKAVAAAGTPIGAICHGPWMLAEADLVRGRRVTSYPSIRTDLVNAGADWVDREVVEDDGVITSRNPGDIPAFNAALLDAIGL